MCMRHLSLEDQKRETKSRAKDYKWMCSKRSKVVEKSTRDGTVKHEHNLELEAAYISNLPRLQIFDRPVQATMSICDFKSNQDIFLILKHFTIQGE